MANNYPNNQQNQTNEVANFNTSLVFDRNQLTGCIEGVCVPMNMTGIVIKENALSLADKVVNMFVSVYNIPELEHCLIYPVRDNTTNEIVDFDAVLYFNTKLNNKDKNIYRAGANGNRTNEGKINLMALAGSRTSNGVFNVSDKFRKAFAGVAHTDNDGKIIIRAVPDSPHIATIECSFFRLISLCLGISSNDPYDFTIAECYPLNNNNNLDFGLIIIKELVTGHNRRSKSGTNYNALDNKRISSRRYR